MFDVVALGELLIDFTPAGKSPSGNVLFERNAGGAPANVLAAITKLGGEAAFIGMVGNDQFGHFLNGFLQEYRIDTSGLKYCDKAGTTLAFVHLDDMGDRSFSFYRDPGADTLISDKDIDYSLIDNTKIFHFGSLSMTAEPAKTATIKAIEYAREKGKIISYDPNWRPSLWESDEHAKEGMLYGLQYADILKISEEELEFLTGVSDLDEGSRVLFEKGIRVIAVTLGAKGCYYRCSAGTGHINTYVTNVIDTTGAGDAFMGGLLYRMSRLDMDIDDIDVGLMEDIIRFSCASGSLCASKRGGAPGMPSIDEVKSCMNTAPKLKLDI